MGFESLEQIHGCDNAILLDPQQQEFSALEKSLKDLPPSSSVFPSSSSSSSSEEFYVEDGADCARAVNQVAADPLENVDSFLREALSSRNRITVLRLEHEIEKFVQNPKQQQLQCKPMPSSYERLAAHRVAQHYHLQSMVIDCNAPTGSRILLLKTPESRFPCVRLADVPVDPAVQEKSACAPLEKVAIKQRASGAFKANGCSNAADSGRMTPVKSVEERKEEYNKARARIFSNGELAIREDDQNGMPDAAALEDESASHILQELMIRGGPSSNGDGKDKLEDDFALRAANRVAIFRDREKDMKDPDYDRSYDRYSQRSNTGFGMSNGPFVMHGMYSPSVNINGFSWLDGSGQPRMPIDPASYSTPHHLRGPWAVSAGSTGVVYPNAFYGNFTQGLTSFHSGSDIYFPAQRFAYTGHYGYIDRCQHFSQPGLQCKASFGEVMHRL